jgi:cytochrome c-type biogenesis protein CcmH
VARLAAKQDTDPGNLEGWLRLGRAYAVLHQPDKAADAYDKAANLRPDDVSIPLQEVRALLSDQAPADKLPPRVIGLLKHIEATNPDEPLVLWNLGMAAAQDASIDEARLLEQTVDQDVSWRRGHKNGSGRA